VTHGRGVSDAERADDGSVRPPESSAEPDAEPRLDATPKGRRSRTPGAWVAARPVLRGRIHQVAAFVSIPAGLVLVLAGDSALDRLAAVVYAVSLTALFSVSATYHLVNGVSESVRLQLRKLDHSMIFVLIGGCYTPVCLLALPSPVSWIMLGVVWALVIFGVVLKAAGLHATRASIGSWLYPVLGWLAVVALPWLVVTVGWMGLGLLLAGGLLYTVGAIVLATRRPDPVPTVFGYHEVWHAMGVTAAGIHYVLIWSLVA
jgi:hemolysin III